MKPQIWPTGKSIPLTVLVEEAEGGGYWGHVIEVDGVSSWGRTPEEAFGRALFDIWPIIEERQDGVTRRLAEESVQ